MKKKICIVSSSSLFLNNFLLGILNLLASKNDVFVISNFKSSKLNIDNKNIKTIHIPLLRKPSILKDLIHLMLLLTNLKKINPDLIITTTPKIIFFGIFINFFFKTKKRIHIYTGVYWILFKNIKKFFFKLVDKISLESYSQVFFDSKSQIIFFNNLGFLGNNFSLISNGSIKGVDLSKFKKNLNSQITMKNSFNISKDSQIILYLGRIDLNKGIEILLISFKKILKKNNSIYLFIVGSDEMGIKHYINNKYKSLLPYIKIVNMIPNPEDFINMSDVVCLPSLREGFGNVVIEASACEKPIVGSDIEGLSESLIDGFNGLKFEVNNSYDLYSKLLLIISNKELSNEYGKKGRKFVEKNFDSKKVINNFYKQILNYI